MEFQSTDVLGFQTSLNTRLSNIFVNLKPLNFDCTKERLRNKTTEHSL